MEPNNQQTFIDYVKKQHALYANVFNTDSGKALMVELRKRFFLNRSTIANQNDINEKTLIWNEAQRAIILEFINLSDKEFVNDHIKMLENKEKE